MTNFFTFANCAGWTRLVTNKSQFTLSPHVTSVALHVEECPRRVSSN